MEWQDRRGRGRVGNADDSDTSAGARRHRGHLSHRSGSAGSGLAAIRERRGSSRGTTASNMTATRGKAEDVDFKRLGVVHGPSQRQRAQERTRRNQAQNERKGQSQIKRMTNSNTRLRKTESAPTTTRPAMSGREQARNDTPGSVGRAGTRGSRANGTQKS